SFPTRRSSDLATASILDNSVRGIADEPVQPAVLPFRHADLKGLLLLVEVEPNDAYGSVIFVRTHVRVVLVVERRTVGGARCMGVDDADVGKVVPRSEPRRQQHALQNESS